MRPKLSFPYLSLLSALLLVLPAKSAADALESEACAGVNGFLNQINIASIINNSSSLNLTFTIAYRDSSGVLQGSYGGTLAPFQKYDQLLSLIGLQPNTIGTVCVETDAMNDGAWFGGVAIYKPDARSGAPNFQVADDFALYYPFKNPFTGEKAVPLNTYHIGMPLTATVANWISISDAIPDDAKGLRGTFYFYADDGTEIGTYEVNLPDGGRDDIDGHSFVGGSNNAEAFGMANFVPEDEMGMDPQEYYLTVTRYFYDCLGASCENFYTAFTIPLGEPFSSEAFGSVPTAKNEVSVIEYNSAGDNYAVGKIDIFDEAGTSLGFVQQDVAKWQTKHQIVNIEGPGGLLPGDQLGSAKANVSIGRLNLTSVFYRLNSDGSLRYAYAAPFAESVPIQQVSQFNSFIQHGNEIELVNTLPSAVAARVRITDFAGNVVWNNDAISLSSNATRRVTLLLPDAPNGMGGSYGTISIHSDMAGVLVRSLVSKGYDYTLTFPGIETSGLGAFDDDVQPTAINKPIRIMPLGDSITESQDGQPTYRYFLQQSLEMAGYQVDYVGTKFGVNRHDRGARPLFSNFDQDHEGHSGWRVDQIIDNIDSWYERFRPEIVLIHLGTNDIIQGDSVSSTAAELEELVQKIRAHNPLVKMVLAQIIPYDHRGNSARPIAKITQLNALIPGVVNRTTQTTSPVLLADQYTGYSSGADNFDGIHPGYSGCLKMSGVWFNKVAELLAQ